jgi:hypothetical protein
MLGSLSEVDNAAQEAWLRLGRTDANGAENLSAWLTTVVGRVCLHLLRSRRSRDEEPLAGRLPYLLVDRVDGIDPEHEGLLADSVGLARSSCLRRCLRRSGLAFVLYDIFAAPSTRSRRPSIAPPEAGPGAPRRRADRARGAADDADGLRARCAKRGGRSDRNTVYAR